MAYYEYFHSNSYTEMGTSEAVYRYTAVQTFGFGKTIGTTFLR